MSIERRNAMANKNLSSRLVGALIPNSLRASPWILESSRWRMTKRRRPVGTGVPHVARPPLEQVRLLHPSVKRECGDTRMADLVALRSP